jgi:GNAT superfamily N-acetyltransferase
VLLSGIVRSRYELEARSTSFFERLAPALHRWPLPVENTGGLLVALNAFRETIPLSGVWRFQPDPHAEGERLGYSSVECDRRRWREVALPGAFEDGLPALEGYEGACWFSRLTELPERWRGRHIELEFEGVNNHARVWINGRLAGENRDPFLPFRFDVTELVHTGEQNQITVRADSTRIDGEVPGLKRGWRPFGGILRELRLVASDALRIDGVRTLAEPNAEGGRFQQEVLVCNHRSEAARLEVNVELRMLDGALVAEFQSATVEVAPRSSAVVTLGGAVESVQSWHPDTPVLYRARTQISAGGAITDRQELDIGFRSVRTEGCKLLINHRPIYLVGFNRHEDTLRSKMCPDPDTAKSDFLAMKEAGANFVRLCHYPHHPSTLALCDEIGLVVMAEIPLYFWSQARFEQDGVYERTLESAKRQLTRLIQRDYNHPCIISWSVSNESREELPDVVAGNRELIQHVHAVDASRLAVHVSNRWPPKDAEPFASDDVVCVNGYPHLFDADAEKAHALQPEKITEIWQDRLKALHSVFPDKPILVTEFGGVSFSGVFGNAVGEDTHARDLELQFRGMQADYIAGACIWCFADHPWTEDIGMACGFGGAHTAPFGVVGRNRAPRAAYWATRRIFREKRGAQESESSENGTSVLMLRPHMDHIPQADFPAGFSMRPMRHDEAGLWTDIQRDSERLFTVGSELFQAEFGDDPDAWSRRCFFIVNALGVALGTISAWYSRGFNGQDHGRIHWFAIRPAWQGKGLARPALSYAMNVLAAHHQRAYLATSWDRPAAIKLYLDYGFLPAIDSPASRRKWQKAQDTLQSPVLAQALENA